MNKELSPAERFRMALDGYVGCQSPYCFIRRADKAMLAPHSFNMLHNRTVNAIVGLPARYKDNAAKFAIASPAFNVVESICYRPDGAPIIDGKFNMWTDPGIEALAEKPEIFLRHMRYLIPNDAERHLLLAWLAWIVQHPDQKVMFAILIVGRGGTGKSWLGKVMQRLFGKDNVVMLEKEDALKEIYNGFSENKRFVFVHETPAKQMAEIADKLRGLITESEIQVRRMHMERYPADNFANLMMIANEQVELKLTNRRWAIISANDDPVGVDDNGQPTPAHKAYYDRLWNVIPEDGSVTDELRRILHYLQTLPLDHPKVAFDRLVPPMTATKKEAASIGEDGERTIASFVLEARENREGPFRFDLFTQEEVAEHCGGTVGHALSDAMTEAGCRKLRYPNGGDVQLRLGTGKARRLWARSKTIAERFAKASAVKISDAYKAEHKGVAKVPPMPGADTSPDFE
ncbi:MAG TPA: primase-helicase family protein [Xanthobacteraceae bacterium]|nr:primase-helicase family protein [Xanthobacteraceae bacterium]